jgi:hypothetical protein
VRRRGAPLRPRCRCLSSSEGWQRNCVQFRQPSSQEGHDGKAGEDAHAHRPPLCRFFHNPIACLATNSVAFFGRVLFAKSTAAGIAVIITITIIFTIEISTVGFFFILLLCSTAKICE